MQTAVGPSTTQLFANLSQALEFPSNCEIVLSSIDHEANISPWLRAAKVHGLIVKWWTPSSGLILTPENLRPLLSERTRLVACTHTSNVLGTIHDIKAIAEEVHKVPGAMLCVDGVAFAPHREVDVEALNVDFYSFSWYKVVGARVVSVLWTGQLMAPQVYGPHIAVLYASPSARTQVQSLGHYFHTPAESLEIKLGLAASSYELVASIPSILAYFGPDRKQTWEAISLHEEKIQSILLRYLNSKEDVRIHGEKSGSSALRVPVVSFSIKGRSSREVVEKVDKCSEFGIRWGHFYSKRIVDDLLHLKVDGVVRVSMVHYNTGQCRIKVSSCFQPQLICTS